MLKSEGTVDVATIIELRNFNDILAYITERKLNDLSYKSLSDLNKYIESRTGLKLFKSHDSFNKVLLVSEIRNLIAHNDCRINSHFQSRVPKETIDTLSISDKGKIILSDQWAKDAASVLDTVTFDFDEAAAQKFGLDTLNRMTSFLLRD